jgi:hypothetical protein
MTAETRDIRFPMGGPFSLSTPFGKLCTPPVFPTKPTERATHRPQYESQARLREERAQAGDPPQKQGGGRQQFVDRTRQSPAAAWATGGDWFSQAQGKRK